MATSTKRSSVENGLTFGVIALAIVVIFAVGLPRWHQSAGEDPITLPDTLSGGFVAADTPAGTAALNNLKTSGGVTDQQIQQFVSAATQFHGQNATDATNALGVATAGRYYVSQDGKIISITAARGSQSAWFPGVGSFSKHGDVTCFSASGSSSSVDCRRTSDSLTVEANAQGVDADTTAAAIDEVYNGIAR